MPDAPDVVLSTERDYLTRARAHLARMRERTLSLDVQGGDRVSSEYLAATLAHRAASLVDDPTSTLFFGRTDHTDGSRWYIGRRHVADEEGDPVVVDWRADISRAFYRASPAEPLGVHLRRRFGLESGRITAVEDEIIDRPGADSPAHSAILAREIERPRVGPMRDIVATIQPEQDVIVRFGPTTSVCVQGAPGTGKTAVGLHRAAWLLYAHRERLQRAGVLVVGPNRSFLEHVAQVLPSLGEVEVRHTTALDLVTASTGASVKALEPAAAALVKGDARMAEVLARAVSSHRRRAVDAVVVPRGAYRWRVGAHRVQAVLDDLAGREVRYDSARALLAQRLAHEVLVKMEEAGDSPDDRVQAAVARTREVRAAVDLLWPKVTPAGLLHRLYTDEEFRRASCEGLLDEDAQELLRHAPGRAAPRSAGAARWTVADLALLDEVHDLLVRTPSLAHVVLDEAQDLSPMQLRAVGRRASTGSMTVLGDIAQGTTPWATDSWEAALSHLGQPGAHLEELVRGFRVPAAVITWASLLLPAIAPGLTPPEAVREDPGTLQVREVPAEQVGAAAVRAVTQALLEPGSVGLITADAGAPALARLLTRAGIEHAVLADGPATGASPGSSHDPAPDGEDAATDEGPGDSLPPRVSVVPATLAKGLEFDRVVVVEPAAIAAAEPDERTGLRRVYVVLTRAVSALEVVHHEPLPGALLGTGADWSPSAGSVAAR